MLGRYAVLSSQWINENPVGFLIQKQIDYEEGKNRFKSVNNCVRNIIDLIERVLTYKYSKYLKCYLDIFEFHLTVIKKDIDILNIAAYLELGAYNPTTVSLLSFGISRTTAIRIKKIIGDNNLNREKCKKWLSENYQKEKNKLPKLCQEDFDKNYN